MYKAEFIVSQTPNEEGTMKKIAYLGAGTWGFTLSTLLGRNGHHVTVWARDPALAAHLQATRVHPKLPPLAAPDIVSFTADLAQALRGADVIVESVTAAGIRAVFTKVLALREIHIPVILTSKGIEQDTGLLLPEVLEAMLGSDRRQLLGCLSGPSLADEVMEGKPTSIVCSAYDAKLMKTVHQMFCSPSFRVYPNSDLLGVSFGGAIKNIIAIACGISDGLECGDNAKAALMTRGLHEMRKLCLTKECRPETINGLSGMGDLCVTCLSTRSRNYRYGRLIAEGMSPEGARQKIGMAVEGIYSCVSAHQLGHKFNVSVPITDAIYQIIYEGMHPRQAVQLLLQRLIKEEHL
jgi:glycerol-3-phosphate dehydrogenase (NAD(P)+)